MQKEVDQVKEAVATNINKINERGDHLDNLLQKADALVIEVNYLK